MEQSKAPVRFELTDPRDGENGVTYVYRTQAEMERKANEIGASRFQGITAAHAVVHFQKLDGQWQPFDPEAQGAPWGIDLTALERVAARRAADQKQLGLNAIESGIEQALRQPEGEADGTRQTELTRAKRAPKAGRLASIQPGGNQVDSDEIFTASQDSQPLISADIEKQYLRIGNKFCHPKNTDWVAFEDKGNKLETKSNSKAIAEILVRLAQARGWDEIKVTGTETFRREVWREAAARGMHVKGYAPSEQDHAALAARLGKIGSDTLETDNQRFRARGNVGERPRPAREAEAKRTDAPPTPATQRKEEREDARRRSAIGVLAAHGAAKYLHDEKHGNSFDVPSRGAQGEEKTLWGVDLERALAESGAKGGDSGLIANAGPEPVTRRVPKHDQAVNVIGHDDKKTHRSARNVQRAEAFAQDAAEAVKHHPELAGAAAAAAAIDKQAAADGLTPQQRAIVMARVQQNIIHSIERGDLPEIKVRDERGVRREHHVGDGPARGYER